MTAPLPRLLALHELQELTREGARPMDATPARLAAAERAARALWPTLDVGDWPAQPPQPVSTFRANAGGEVLVHWPAARRDCFLILVFADGATWPATFVLFDIGAMYQEAYLVCPAFDIEAVAEEATIRDCLARLADAGPEAYAVLDRREGTYMQVYVDAGQYHVEFQLVSTASHWGLVDGLDAEGAIDVFCSYAFGNNEFARTHTWEKLDLPDAAAG